MTSEQHQRNAARTFNERELFYERFAHEFDDAMNRYEVTKRLRIVFDDALGDVPLADMRFLDAGCGTGLFSQVATERGARVTALDVGPGLLARVREKCGCETVVGDVLTLPFPDESFDVVLCTEVVEHTPNPDFAVGELARVARAGGTIVVTTPNRVWHPMIRLANLLRIRPYEGLENWVRWHDLRRAAERSGLRVTDHRGFNALPFVHPLTYGVIDRLDRLGQTVFGRLMINMLLVARKEPAAPGLD